VEKLPWLQTHRATLPLFTLITVYVFLSLSSFVGIWAYIVPSICWITLALITLKIHGATNIRSKFSKTLTILAALTAATQIVILIFVAIFTSFGRSPYASSSTALNILYFSSGLIGTELVRAQLITTFPKNKRLIGIALITLLFAIINFSPARYLALGETVETTRFLGANLLPTIAAGLFASFLALLGGPIASIAYLGTLQTFEWFSPILPTPDWTIQALIGTLVPTIGFIIIHETTKPFTLLRHGLLSRKEATFKIRKNKKNSFPFGWIAIALIALFLMWSNSGLLGFQPSIVASGSMQPNLNVGDMAIVIHSKPFDIKVGDIIQYRGESEPVIHRVINKYQEQSQTYFITKGDANNAQDPKPVSENQVIGKATFIIPKLGWASIGLKEAASATYIFISTTLPSAAIQAFTWLTSTGVYITASLGLIVLSYTLAATVKRKGKVAN
jgi:signal peptidase